MPCSESPAPRRRSRPWPPPPSTTSPPRAAGSRPATWWPPCWHPGVGTYLAPGSPLDFANVPRLGPRRAPVLGEHTDEVLDDVLGLSVAEIGRLHEAGTIAGANRPA